MLSSFDQGLVDGEHDALHKQGYDPDYYDPDEQDSIPGYMEGYDAGYEHGIQLRAARVTATD